MLRGLHSTVCPECGRAFDPRDPATRNLGRPVGALARRLMRRTGRATVLLTLFATMAMVFASRWPVQWPVFSCRDVPFYLPVAEFPDALTLKTPADIAYAAGLYVWIIVGVLWLLRIMPRALALCLIRPPTDIQPRGWRRDAMVFAMLLLAGACVTLSWPWRLAQHTFSQRPVLRWGPVGLAPAIPRLDDAGRWAMLRAGVMQLPDPRDRIRAICSAMSDPAPLLAILLDAVSEEPDAAVRETQLHLIGLYRRPESAATLLAMMDDADATVRAAAADALGIVHAPAYPIPLSPDYLSQARGSRPSSIASCEPLLLIDPLVMLSRYGNPQPPVCKWNDTIAADPVDLPRSARVPLERMMLDGSTAMEREAAARALVRWPPDGYRLRVAEWGVWIADRGELKLAQSVLDEIPPFVHRTGNSLDSFGDRINQIMFITKPVLHVTASHPMALDVEVRFRRGRPWFAYPRPDDFGMSTYTVYIDYKKRADGECEKDGNGKLVPDTQPSPVEGLHNPKLAALTDLREGYPWLTPEHRSYGAVGGGTVAISNAVLDLGLHWQSLIVTPQKQPWMNEPTAPADPKFAWWQKLRAVPSSWIASRGEAERFLYYDGPSRTKALVAVTREGDKLIFRRRKDEVERHYATDGRLESLVPTPAGNSKPNGAGVGLLIVVRDGRPVARKTDVPEADSELIVADLPQVNGNAIEPTLLGLLVGAGLSEPEARGLLDCWRGQFLSTPGTRFLHIVPASEYDRLCPMRIAPQPTEFVRVGIILTELGR
jgi:hypothetical protein